MGGRYRTLHCIFPRQPVEDGGERRAVPWITVERLADLIRDALALGFAAGRAYQIFALKLSGRTIGSPALQAYAWANWGMFANGPFTRYSPGE